MSVARAFVQYPNLRSTTVKYDPCQQSGISCTPSDGLSCKTCRVFLMSDRFLGDNFQKNVMGSNRKYPYSLIADTWDCNFRCWFCYSHHYWQEYFEKHKSKIKREFIPPNILAKQFACKLMHMQKMRSVEDREKPLSMLRISGGEPLFSTPKNQVPPIASSGHDNGINYWLTFFKTLDAEVTGLIRKDDLYFVKGKEWGNFSTTRRFPVALMDFGENDGTPTFPPGENRLIVRFDTNGLLFSDHEFVGNRCSGKEYAEKFVGGLKELFDAGFLNSICIRLTLSFKGSTPTEFLWSESKGPRPINSENNNKDFAPSEHPQYSSYVNIKNAIDKYCKDDTRFANCIYLNPERGVMHQADNNVFVFYKTAIDWDNFTRITGIKLSTVRNDFSLISNRTIKAMLYRYVGKGAVVEARYTDKGRKMAYSIKNNSEVSRFASFYYDNRKKTDFNIIIYPD